MPIVRRFIGRTHKENESITDCQDYVQADEAKNCFAIADGASQSFYPSIWAELLVHNFCQNPDINPGNWKAWLQPIQDKWSLEVEERVKKAKSESSPIWVTNQNRLNSRVPATSTFIGLQFTENKVKVSIVGDSCLFVLRGHKLAETHLLKKSNDFNDRPEYFASYANHNEYVPNFADIPLNHEESPEPLYFILATDALSEYIFKCVEHKEAIFKDLLSITSQKEFENFVSKRRNLSSVKMKNDDVALMILSISNATILESPSQLTDTTEGDSEVPISKQLKEEVVSNDIKELKKEVVPKNNIKELRMENRRLKHHRSALGALATVFLLSTFVLSRPNNNLGQLGKDTSPETNTAPIKTFKTIKLPQKTVVYANQDLTKAILVNPLSNSFEVVIRDENEKWTQVETTLYAHESTVSKCSICTKNEFEIQSNKDIRVVYTNESKLDNAIFGQLKNPTKFEKLEFQYFSNWYKFKFVGYIKKEDIKQ